MTNADLVDGRLDLNGRAVLSAAGPGLELETDPYGVFIHTRLKCAAWRSRIKLGMPEGLRRFVSCYRYDPYWMTPATGDRAAQVPVDTQYLLFEREDGGHVLMVPLVDDPFHVSLEGTEEGLFAVLDTGDPDTKSACCLVAYIAMAADPYELIARAARQVCERLGVGRLRVDKPCPDFVNDFGWCTWDAFYREVSRADVGRGLESFRRGGVEPHFMILDDGWQNTTDDTNEGRLRSFAANHKFDGGLGPTVDLAKGRYRIRTFLVWHTVHGYWGGADSEALAEYAPKRTLRWYCPEVLAHAPGMNAEYCGAYASVPEQDRLASFYRDYHRALAAEGVDGVKVDNQASAEGLSVGRGGRVRELAAVRSGLEASARQHFSGRLMNCMSGSSEMFYFAADSMLTRTSADFWPQRPASHGLHLCVNAWVSLWFGEFVQPDWDMFQSGHPAGAFHAAARAISGGPIYVSDKPDGQDFALLRRLVLSDGTIPRCRDIARPTPDCLYRDPTHAPLLLKLFNENGGSYVVGVFNARYLAGHEDRIQGQVGPADIPALSQSSGSPFALYLVIADRLVCVDGADTIPIELSSQEFEIVSIAPIVRGLAVMGLLGMFNPGGTVRGQGWAEEMYVFEVRDGGRVLLYAQHPPRAVRIDGYAVRAYDHDTTTCRLVIDIEGQGTHRVEIDIGEPR